MNVKYLTLLIPIISFYSKTSQSSQLEATSKIVNGIYSKTDHIPWQIDFNYGYCGGSIIDQNWMLTAAHCIAGKDQIIKDNILDLVVGANGISIENGEQDSTYYKIEKVFVHPDYNYNKNINDIALVKIPDSSKFPANSTIKLITASEQKIMEQQFTNEWVDNQKRPGNLMASGWGVTNPAVKDDYDPHLKQTLLSGVPLQNCISMTNSFLELDVSSQLNNVLCAMSPDPELATDTGKGDSGGPLIWQNPNHKDDKDRGLRLVGVTSYTYTTGSNQAPTYYAKVAMYRGWIEKVIGKDLNSIPVSTFAHDPFTQDYSAAPTIRAVDIVRTEIPSGSGGSTSVFSLLALLGLLWRKRLTH
ncbi:S1 family peptidase [Photobacterium sp. J15]|uniref:S1 family peptidase n=1 Tax=Photobacterium sp. J15 TaxID=265901 RepID=UPI0007E436F9|nr:serine protease [Photobacterium sp. J15]